MAVLSDPLRHATILSEGAVVAMHLSDTTTPIVAITRARTRMIQREGAKLRAPPLAKVQIAAFAFSLAQFILRALEGIALLHKSISFGESRARRASNLRARRAPIRIHFVGTLVENFWFKSDHHSAEQMLVLII